MPLYRFNGEKYEKIGETHLKSEKVVEVHFEKHIAQNPMLIGEPLYIVGRKVAVADLNEHIDVLGLDPNGNAVIICIDRRKQKEPVLMHGLRFAAALARWHIEDFEKAAIRYREDSDEEFDFEKEYRAFCRENGQDETPFVNRDQRVLLVGSNVRQNLADIALWLQEHGVKIKLITVQPFKSVQKP